jgi:hypothetical protein
MATQGKRKGIPRPVEGSAHRVFKKDLYEELLDAIRELLANGMTWTYIGNVPPEERKIYLTLNEGNSQNLACDDPGIGIFPSKWKQFITMGHKSTDEEHNKRMLEEDYISQIGIGINSYLGLSGTEDVEFRSVTEDDQGRKTGLIGRMWGTDDEIFMEEEPWVGDPKEALNHKGTKVIIKDLIKHQDLKMNKIKEYIAKTFALKLRDYQVLIRDVRTDLEYERIHPSHEFCTKHLVDLFPLSDGTMVRGDIHRIEKVDEKNTMAIRMCVKKVRMEDLTNEKLGYLAHGIITINSPNVKFQANRGGFRKQQDSLYMELETKLKEWLEVNDFKKPEQGKEEKLKEESTIKEITGASILKLATDERYKDILLRLAGSLTKLGVQGKGKGLESEGVGEEWEDYAKNQTRILTPEEQRGRFKRERRDPLPPVTPPIPRIKDNKGPKLHHGHADGGTRTWQEPVTRPNRSGESTVMPDIPPVSALFEFPYPVSQIIEDEYMLK